MKINELKVGDKVKLVGGLVVNIKSLPTNTFPFIVVSHDNYSESFNLSEVEAKIQEIEIPIEKEPKEIKYSFGFIPTALSQDNNSRYMVAPPTFVGKISGVDTLTNQTIEVPIPEKVFQFNPLQKKFKITVEEI